jgi:hypothetical protein
LGCSPNELLWLLKKTNLSMLKTVIRSTPCTLLLSQVLLSDVSGFLPSLAEAQGNEPKQMSAWQPAYSKHSRSSQKEGAARHFDYIYKDKGPWGDIRSNSRIDMQAAMFEGEKLLLENVQKMPDLPSECLGSRV